APDRTRRIRHLRKSTRCRCRDTEFAAWTSIATVWFGCRSTADISRASTAENAQARSTGQAPSAVRSAPKDGRSTRFPGQALPAIRVPRKVRIISGSTSTNILGLGANTPIATGNQSDSLHALVGGRIVELRVPYPMGFYAKNIDGRIDDPGAGWKGRALWVTSGNRTPVHIEGIDAPAPGAPGNTDATH